MASDGLLPAHLLRTHPRAQAPVAAVVLTGALVSASCLLVHAQTLYGLAVAGTLFAFSVVAVAVAVLRFRQPLRPRAFRVPMIWFISPAAVIVNLFLISNILPGVAMEFAICAAAACFLWLFARKGFTL